MLPRVFIGSSKEGLAIAQAVAKQLLTDADVNLWNDKGVFPLGEMTLSVLEKYANKYDFAVIVMTPDDTSTYRKSVTHVPRDNLLFELGIFIGRIGAERTLVIRSDSPKMRLPTDLAGLVVAYYSETLIRTDPLASVSNACSQVRDRIKTLGISEGTRVIQLSTAVDKLAGLVDTTASTLAHHEAAQSKPIRFDNVAQAEAAMLKCMEAHIRNGDDIHFDWLGMTMFNVWNTLPSLLNKVAALRPRSMLFRVAMLSEQWLSEHKINASWTADSANHQAASIQRFFDEKRADGFSSWLNEIQRYSHMPAVHGGLINGRVLIGGVCRWDHGNLWAGDRPYEMYVDGDTNHGTDKIAVFRGWFEACWKSGIDPALMRWKAL